MMPRREPEPSRSEFSPKNTTEKIGRGPSKDRALCPCCGRCRSYQTAAIRPYRNSRRLCTGTSTRALRQAGTRTFPHTAPTGPKRRPRWTDRFSRAGNTFPANPAPEQPSFGSDRRKATRPVVRTVATSTSNAPFRPASVSRYRACLIDFERPLAIVRDQ